MVTVGAELFWMLAVLTTLHGLLFWVARRDLRLAWWSAPIAFFDGLGLGTSLRTSFQIEEAPYAWWSALVIGPVLGLIVWLVATRIPVRKEPHATWRLLPTAIVFGSTLLAVASGLWNPDGFYDSIFMFFFG